MNIASILARKGSRIVTCRAEQSIRQALSLLAEHNIGALVVVDDAGGAVGMLSERRRGVARECDQTDLVALQIRHDAQDLIAASRL